MLWRQTRGQVLQDHGLSVSRLIYTSACSAALTDIIRSLTAPTRPLFPTAPSRCRKTGVTAWLKQR